MKGKLVVGEQARKKVCVLSDSELLYNVIKANLEQITVQVERSRPDHVEEPGAGDCDLLVLALSSPTGEPVVALYEAALVAQVGELPLLIISDRRFEASHEGRIYHLDFPFDPEDLCEQVKALLAFE